MSEKKFYVVWNPSKHSPMRKHENHELALNEAKRLASLNSGEEFIVLMPVFLVKKNDVVVKGYENLDYSRLGTENLLQDLDNDGIPF